MAFFLSESASHSTYSSDCQKTHSIGIFSPLLICTHCSNFIRKVPIEGLVFGVALVAVLSPVLQEISDYYAYWINGYFEYDFILSDVVLGYLVTGYFPIFPWIIFNSYRFYSFAPSVYISHNSLPRTAIFKTAFVGILEHRMHCSLSYYNKSLSCLLLFIGGLCSQPLVATCLGHRSIYFLSSRTS